MVDNQARFGMDRREFVRRALTALAGVAVLLSACAAPQSTAIIVTQPTLAAQQGAAVATSQPTAVAPEAQPTLVSAPAVKTSGVACPSGVLNDPYPGHCRRYVDNNSNGYCDLSEPGSGSNMPLVQG